MPKYQFFIDGEPEPRVVKLDDDAMAERRRQAREEWHAPDAPKPVVTVERVRRKDRS
jgi:hypothetical protein